MAAVRFRDWNDGDPRHQGPRSRTFKETGDDTATLMIFGKKTMTITTNRCKLLVVLPAAAYDFFLLKLSRLG